MLWSTPATLKNRSKERKKILTILTIFPLKYIVWIVLISFFPPQLGRKFLQRMEGIGLASMWWKKKRKERKNCQRGEEEEKKEERRKIKDYFIGQVGDAYSWGINTHLRCYCLRIHVVCLVVHSQTTRILISNNFDCRQVEKSN